MTGICIRKRKEGFEPKTPKEESPVKTVADIGNILPQGKECLEASEAVRGKPGFSPGALRSSGGLASISMADSCPPEL